MTAFHQIRGCNPGSGEGSPDSAANSRVDGGRESVTTGPATGDTLTVEMPLADGGALRVSAVHGRVEMQVRIGKGRVWQTTPVTAERAEYYAARLSEISQHARAQRQNRGA